eukprot:SAG31_NODE_2389_length_5806_cov_3.020151_1_plen_126_part_00
MSRRPQPPAVPVSPETHTQRHGVAMASLLHQLTMALGLPALALAMPEAPRCNPEQLELVDQRWTVGTHEGVAASGGQTPVVMLPQDKGGESPACLDGSPYGFYFVPSKAGSTKWTVSINGGSVPR